MTRKTILRRIALVTAREAQALDEDLPPLVAALHHSDFDVHVVHWDAACDWTRFDMLLLRSTWDYMSRLTQFLVWAEDVDRTARLVNSFSIVRWNIDKHYLGALAAAGVPVVPTAFIEPGEDPKACIADFLCRHDCWEFVIKPAIGAGSRDAQRHARDSVGAAVEHAARLLREARSVLVQPYLSRVDEEGEAALIFFGGEFSHSIRKGALLRPGAAATTDLFAPETIAPRRALVDELAVARQALSALPFGTPLYARVDLIREGSGKPVLLELELIEPSLFFAHAPGSAQRFADAIGRFVSEGVVPV